MFLGLVSSSIRTTVGLHPLIVVDIIRSCCSGKFERPEWNISFSKVREMIPRLKRFTDTYRMLGGQIVWVRTTPWTEEYLPRNINRLYHENPDATFYTTHDVEESVEFCEGIEIQPQDMVFTKNTYSAFANPSLLRYMHDDKEDTCLIAGIFSGGCVNATIVDGFTKGLFILILSDLVETVDRKQRQEQQHQLLTDIWPLMYGHVMTSQEFLKRLAETQRHQNLVRSGAFFTDTVY